MSSSAVAINSPPVVASVSIVGNPTTANVGDMLTAAYTQTDADGDPDNSTRQWVRDFGSGPVAISGETGLSYTIDIYRGKLEPVDDFVSFAVFVSMFPQLVAGPIERAKNMLPQILTPRTVDAEDVSRGIYLILRGYVKKLVVADNVAVYVDKIFLLETANPLMIAVGSVGLAARMMRI